MEFRAGSGYDVHRLAEGRKLILCGEEITFEKGLLGHSDADVAVHALMDAMLGAAGLGDIGRHFPDTDMKYKDISSMKLLKEVKALLEEKGWTLNNADITIMAQRPKLLPHIEKMKLNVAEALEKDVSCINVKATTTEKLGFVGREEGIAAEAVCILTRN
ncbi:MAG: 2-C-methyl-D-erythritol 2,4-cyclodiphosphate synthase [Anaerovoracaceae bacterium]